MRTSLFLLAGLLLLVATTVLTRLFASNYQNAPNVALVIYLLAWLALAAFNMWTGVTRAGYGAMEELPIFLLLFGIPAIAAVLVRWKLL